MVRHAKNVCGVIEDNTKAHRQLARFHLHVPSLAWSPVQGTGCTRVCCHSVFTAGWTQHARHEGCGKDSCKSDRALKIMTGSENVQSMWIIIAGLFMSQKVETNQMPIRIDEKIVNMWSVYPHNGILFSHKMERSTDTCCTMDEPWKCYA
jgi:hypothetical protein